MFNISEWSQALRTFICKMMVHIRNQFKAENVSYTKKKECSPVIEFIKLTATKPYNSRHNANSFFINYSSFYNFNGHDRS